MGDILIELSQNIKLPLKNYQVAYERHIQPFFPDAHLTPHFHSTTDLDSLRDFHHASDPSLLRIGPDFRGGSWHWVGPGVEVRMSALHVPLESKKKNLSYNLIIWFLG